MNCDSGLQQGIRPDGSFYYYTQSVVRPAMGREAGHRPSVKVQPTTTPERALAPMSFVLSSNDASRHTWTIRLGTKNKLQVTQCGRRACFCHDLGA